ncbi:DUF354 domain-containing protein [candidate division KSB1 bacterium]|nr:DUF354 domain-containing protein [candidate division KSB1 bacterium]
MTLLFDIVHPVDVNFFRRAAESLERQGHEIRIVYRRRGKLAGILGCELGRFQPRPCGSHQSRAALKLPAQIARVFSLLPFLRSQRVGLILCFGPNSGFAAQLLRIPYLAFTDDFEYKLSFYGCNLFADRHIFPDFIPFRNRKTRVFHGFKELAYLHPAGFRPELGPLEAYGLEPERYVLIRITSAISLNYGNQPDLIPGIVDRVRALGLTPVFSVESIDPPPVCRSGVLLGEPVIGFHSLLYYAAFVVSSGDTVAREAALLGVPALSVGGREMAVNRPLIERGALFCSVDASAVAERIALYADVDYKKTLRPTIEAAIRDEWADTTEIILQHVHDFTG